MRFFAILSVWIFFKWRVLEEREFFTAEKKDLELTFIGEVFYMLYKLYFFRNIQKINIFKKYPAWSRISK